MQLTVREIRACILKFFYVCRMSCLFYEDEKEEENRNEWKIESFFSFKCRNEEGGIVCLMARRVPD